MNLSEEFSKVKDCAYTLSTLSTEKKNKVLEDFSDLLKSSVDEILMANGQDIKDARTLGVQEHMIDRLTLTEDRIFDMADGVTDIINLADPIGEILEDRDLNNGIALKKIRVPIGVIAIIYESRPNVTSDAMALCFKTGNACILRGGKEAINSNTCIEELMKEALKKNGLDEMCAYLIKDTSRKSSEELMQATDYVDILIPRGGKGLIQAVKENSKVPVIETGAGICHIFVDKSAKVDMATNICDNAKTQRPSVCNSCETILVHKEIAQSFLKSLDVKFSNRVKYYGCPKTAEILGSSVTLASEQNYNTEYNDLIVNIKIVQDITDALNHIRKFSTKHSEAIITENLSNADLFLRSVDSACVYHNASTRFTDGAEFGLGAEIGISTQKLHARGPMGLAEVTSYKYILSGTGQVR